MIDEKLLIKRFEALKESFAKAFGNHKYFDKESMVYLFDKLIEKINAMSEK